MSHFSVLIIGENPEEQLIPFCEHTDTDAGDKYFQFKDCTDDVKKQFKSNTRTFFMTPEKDAMLSPYNETFRVKGTFGTGGDSHKVPDNYRKVEIPMKYFYSDWKEYAKDWHGYTLDESGEKCGYKHNPNAKWDWYSLGGRWLGTFILKKSDDINVDAVQVEKPGAFNNERENDCDSALIKDIDFDKMNEKSLKKAEENWNKFQELKKTFESSDKSEEKKKSFEQNAYWDLEIENVKISKKKFLESHKFYTWAVVKGDKWYESGEMGWWGMSSNNKKKDVWNAEFQKLLSDLDPNTRISLYDCHI